MSSIGLQTSKSELVSLGNANVTLTAADSGKTFLINTALTVGAKTVTLPLAANAKGCRFRFVKALAAPGQSMNITAGAATMYGNVIVAVAAAVLAEALDGTTTFTFLSQAGTLGDYLDLECDGTYYYGKSVVVAANSYALA